MNDKVFFLTGCASGIGKRLSNSLIQKGAKVIASDLQKTSLMEIAEEHSWIENQVLLQKLDVRKPSDWKKALEASLEKFGQVDVLANIAGYLKPGFSHSEEYEEISKHIDINLKGTMIGTSQFSFQMIKQGFGHIINFGSLASLAPVPGLSLYSASKFGVRGFSLAVAEELREHGINVSLVLPDAVKTPMLDRQKDYDEAWLTFSGSKYLTLDDIEQAFFEDILVNKPLEITLPKSRGTLAKVSGLTPQMNKFIAPVFKMLGKRNQDKYKN